MILERSFGSPTITKDGVSVAKEIELEDKFENMGAQMVKEVASKTSDTAGVTVQPQQPFLLKLSFAKVQSWSQLPTIRWS